MAQPDEVMAIPESSWGTGGTHWTWEPVHQAEWRMEQLAEEFPDADKSTKMALNQAARELLLLQSSDWPFLVTTGQARAYAIERFQSHVDRFTQLADLPQSNDTAGAWRLADELWEQDKAFPTVDYQWFAQRQGRAD